MNYSPLIGLIILIADIYAIVMVVQSSATLMEQLAWAIGILLLPVIGVVVGFPGGFRAKNRSDQHQG
ncbi:MAG: PLDc N-terminal domain-containing protein [Gammaproteobacteria bacterium]|nr:PLDc N-terminal domain-containing protein [Gammaproteobacteria bacterium]